MQERPNQYSAAYKRTVVLLLMTAYTFNAMDRSIISIVSQPMKLDLKLTDTELGLLSGTAFAVLYAFGGIPIARLAERVSRVNILGVALIVWSSLSALCGAAGSFAQLLLIRVGVGVAEAGNFPVATCRPIRASWLRVFPPGDYGAVYVRDRTQTCASSAVSVLTVTAVRPAA